jgi:hypothetical protein
MKSVELRLQTRDLSHGLISVREWLDRRGVETSAFTYNCDRGGAEALVHVSFKLEQEAAAFAEELGGAVVGSSSSSPMVPLTRQLRNPRP